MVEMASTQPLAIGETLSWPTPDGRFVIAVQRTTADCWNVTTERGGFRIDELARTFGDEDQARTFARDIAKRLRDGATVEQVVAAIQPAADLISAATQLLELAADVAALSDAQRTAIAGATDGRIVRGNGVSVSTLRALEGLHLGDCHRRGYTITGLTLTARGLAMRGHILTHRTTIAA